MFLTQGLSPGLLHCRQIFFFFADRFFTDSATREGIIVKQKHLLTNQQQRPSTQGRRSAADVPHVPEAEPSTGPAACPAPCSAEAAMPCQAERRLWHCGTGDSVTPRRPASTSPSKARPPPRTPVPQQPESTPSARSEQPAGV